MKEIYKANSEVDVEKAQSPSTPRPLRAKRTRGKALVQSILDALDELDGRDELAGHDYLVWLGINKPELFVSLMIRTMPKQINTDSRHVTLRADAKLEEVRRILLAGPTQPIQTAIEPPSQPASGTTEAADTISITLSDDQPATGL